MSGPKDYVLILAAGSIAAELARRGAANAARQRATQERMRRNRERAERKTAKLAQKRAQAAQRTQARIEAERRANELARKRAEAAQREQARIEAERKRQVEAQKRLDVVADAKQRNDARMDAKRADIRDAAERLADAHAQAVRDDLAQRRLNASGIHAENVQRAEQPADVIAEDEIGGLPAPTAEEFLTSGLQASDSDAGADDSAIAADVNALQEKLSELTAWREELADDDAAQQFHRDAVAAWGAAAAAYLAEDSAADGSVAEALDSIDKLCNDAKRLHDEAGTRQADFFARNEMLLHVMDSLKEIGFFVGDPAYADPNDPSGPVLVKATRGSEVMNASIDLSQVVRSVWDGLEDEHCKASFFEYVDQLKTRGVEVQAERADLRAPPILKQQGAKDLPRGQQIGGGA